MSRSNIRTSKKKVVLPEVRLNNKPNSEDGSGDGLNRGIDFDQRNFERGLLHVRTSLDVMEHQANFLRVHLA